MNLTISASQYVPFELGHTRERLVTVIADVVVDDFAHVSDITHVTNKREVVGKKIAGTMNKLCVKAPFDCFHAIHSEVDGECIFNI